MKVEHGQSLNTIQLMLFKDLIVRSSADMTQRGTAGVSMTTA